MTSNQHFKLPEGSTFLCYFIEVATGYCWSTVPYFLLFGTTRQSRPEDAPLYAVVPHVPRSTVHVVFSRGLLSEKEAYVKITKVTFDCSLYSFQPTTSVRLFDSPNLLFFIVILSRALYPSPESMKQFPRMDGFQGWRIQVPGWGKGLEPEMSDKIRNLLRVEKNFSFHERHNHKVTSSYSKKTEWPNDIC